MAWIEVLSLGSVKRLADNSNAFSLFSIFVFIMHGCTSCLSGVPRESVVVQNCSTASSSSDALFL